jgi:hypothetical protein
MKRTLKDVKEKKYRKLIKDHNNRFNSMSATHCRVCGLKRRWEVSGHYKKHWAYKILKELLPTLTEWQSQFHYYRAQPFHLDYPKELPTIRGLYQHEYDKLTAEQKLCFRNNGYPNEANPLFLEPWQKAQHAKGKKFYNEKFVLKEELKSLLYLKEEKNITRMWNWEDSDYRKEENYIRAHNIRVKAAKAIGYRVHFEKDYEFGHVAKRNAILKKEFEEEIYE